MAGTLNFGPVTLIPGTRDFGPALLADTDTMAQLTIDRTIAGGLNSVPPAVAMTVSVFQSNDQGGTWNLLASVGFAGGLIFDRHTNQNETTSGLNVTLAPGAGRIARAEVVLTGQAVAGQGSLTIS